MEQMVTISELHLVSLTHLANFALCKYNKPFGLKDGAHSRHMLADILCQCLRGQSFYVLGSEKAPSQPASDKLKTLIGDAPITKIKSWKTVVTQK